MLTAQVDPDSVITETDEGNNELVETTTVAGDACPGPRRASISSRRSSVGSPDPYPNNGTVTMSFIAVNIGDAGTSLDPSTDRRRSRCSSSTWPARTIRRSWSTRTVATNPASMFSLHGARTRPRRMLSRCFGNLGPGEGVTVTVTFKDVTSPTGVGQRQGRPVEHADRVPRGDQQRSDQQDGHQAVGERS